MQTNQLLSSHIQSHLLAFKIVFFILRKSTEFKNIDQKKLVFFFDQAEQYLQLGSQSYLTLENEHKLRDYFYELRSMFVSLFWAEDPHDSQKHITDTDIHRLLFSLCVFKNWNEEMLPFNYKDESLKNKISESPLFIDSLNVLNKISLVKNNFADLGISESTDFKMFINVLPTECFI